MSRALWDDSVSVKKCLGPLEVSWKMRCQGALNITDGHLW